MAFKIDELFYELDARTAGFEDKISRAQTSVDNFAKFVTGKPLLAAAALGAAIVAIGIASVKMANDVDISMRKVQAAFPAAAGEIGKLRKEIADLSEQTPRSQRELAEAAAQIAEKGVESVDEIVQRLQAVTRIADATGQPLQTVADGLDNIGDAFRLNNKEAERALTLIFGYAQGKVALDEVFTTLQRGGAILADLGVKAEDAGQAMVALIDAGIPRKQAGTVLTTILELTNRVQELRRGSDEQRKAADVIEHSLSRENIAARGFIGALTDLSTGFQKNGIDARELGLRTNVLSAVTRVAEAASKDHRTAKEREAEAYEAVRKAAETNNQSVSALNQLLVNQLNRSLVDLGNVILPTVIKGLQEATQWLRAMKGEANTIGDVANITRGLPSSGHPGITNEFTSFLTRIELDTPEKKRNREFYASLDALANRAQEQGPAGFAGIPQEDIDRMVTNLRALFREHPELIAQGSGEAGRRRDALVLALRQAAEAAAAAAGATGAPPHPPLADLTQEIKDAIANLREAAAATAASATTTEIDDARARVAKFRQEIEALERKAGRPLPELHGALAQVEGEPARIEAKERAAAAAELAKDVSEAVGKQSQVMETALAEFNRMVEKRNAEYAKLGKAPLYSPEQVKRIQDIRQALIDAAKAAEHTTDEIDRVELARAQRLPGTGRAERAGDVVTLQAEASQKLYELRQIANASDEASIIRRKQLLADIGRLQGEINTLVEDEAAERDKIADRIRTHVEQTQAMADAIGKAVDLAVQLSSAFNFGPKLTGIVRSIADIGKAAAQVSPFLEKLRVFQSGAKDSKGNPVVGIGEVLDSATSLVGGILAGVNLIRGLFSDPAAAAERRETLQALHDLKQALLQLKDAYLQNISTEQVTKDISVIEGVLAGIGTAAKGSLGRTALGTVVSTAGEVTYDGRVITGVTATDKTKQAALGDIGKDFGQDFKSGALEAYFAKLDARYGTNLAKFVQNNDPYGLLQALQQVPDALKAELQKLGKFANDAAGIIDRVNYEFDVLGKQDAAERIRAIVDALKAAGIDLGDFADTFATLNNPTSTAEDRQKAIDEALARLASSDKINFGGLTPDQLRALLKEAAGAIPASGAAGTGGYNTDRTITEVTGSRLAAIAHTSMLYLGEIRDNTRAMAQAFGTLPALPAITPPALTPSGITPVNSITFGDIIVPVDAGGLDTASAAAVGDRVGGAIVQRVNLMLGKDLNWKKRGAGTTLRS